jgi:hypothetical protein
MEILAIFILDHFQSPESVIESAPGGPITRPSGAALQTR